MISRWSMLHGDSLALLRDLPDGAADAIITDPPYSSGGFTRGDRMADTTTKYVTTGPRDLARPDFAGDNRDGRGYGYWCALWLSECLRVAKPGSPIALFTDWRQLPTTTDALQAGGWVWRGIMAWDKTEAVRPAMGRPRAQCEFVVWGSAGAMPLRVDVGVLPGVLREKVQQDDKHHITGKPTAVMQQIARMCPPGGIILDPFAGSGTTGIGALLEGRRFIGIDQSSEYCEVATRRLDD
jgi:site-specific DNA-methyltransferase (adenine-specific)